MFVADMHHIYGRFLKLAEEFGHTEAYARELTKLLPLPVSSAPAFLDRVTEVWRYDYGLPFDFPNDWAIGTDQWPEVGILYRVIDAANRNLDPQLLLGWLKRLSNESKHMDVMTEMRPILDLKDEKLIFEVSGRGIGDTTIDWLIEPPGKRPILLEVKNRVVSFIQRLETRLPSKKTKNDYRKNKTPNPANLFKSSIKKFAPSKRSEILQGVWIHTGIKEDIKKLADFFSSLDDKRIHFAVLAGWMKDATILSRSKEDSDYLISIFGIEASGRFISENYDNSTRV